MRTLPELGAIRATLTSALAWPLLMTLHAEANEVDGQPFTRSIFELAQLTDISPVRISALLDQLADADAIGYAPLNGDARTVTVEVL